MKYLLPLFKQSTHNISTYYLSEYIEIIIETPISYTQLHSLLLLKFDTVTIYKGNNNQSNSDELFNEEDIKIFDTNTFNPINSLEEKISLYKSNQHGSIKDKELTVLTNNISMTNIIKTISHLYRVKIFPNSLNFNDNSIVVIY